SILLLDAKTGKQLVEIGQPLNSAGPVHLAFSPDGHTLLSFGREVQFFETASGQERLRFEKLPSFASSAAFSPDGGVLAVGLGDGSIVLYSARNAVMISRLTGHRADVQAL